MRQVAAAFLAERCAKAVRLAKEKQLAYARLSRMANGWVVHQEQLFIARGWLVERGERAIVHTVLQENTSDMLHDFADAVLAIVRKQDTAFIELQQIARTVQVLPLPPLLYINLEPPSSPLLYTYPRTPCSLLLYINPSHSH